MISRFELDDFHAETRGTGPLAPCQSPDHRQAQDQALVQDMAQQLCGQAAALGFLVAKGPATSLVMGVTGNRRRPSLTLELTRKRGRGAYLLFSDPLLGVVGDDGLPACAKPDRLARELLKIHQFNGTRTDLIEMRRLLTRKLASS